MDFDTEIKTDIFSIYRLYNNNITDAGAKLVAQIIEECPQLEVVKYVIDLKNQTYHMVYVTSDFLMLNAALTLLCSGLVKTRSQLWVRGTWPVQWRRVLPYSIWGKCFNEVCKSGLNFSWQISVGDTDVFQNVGQQHWWWGSRSICRSLEKPSKSY